MLTDNQKIEYIKGKGQACPKCKSKDLEVGSSNFCGAIVTAEVWCNDCGLKWEDVYTLTGVND